MTNLFDPLPRPTLSPASIARLQASGYDPIIPGNISSYQIINLYYSPPNQVPYHLRRLFPNDIESEDTLMYIFGMTRPCAARIWRQYIAARRRQIVAAIGLKMNVPEGVDWELIVDEKALADGEGQESMLMKGLKVREKIWGLNEYMLGIWIPGVLRKYGDPNGMDEGAKEQFKRCMIGAGISPGLIRHWTVVIWGPLSQLGTLGQLLRFLWKQLWEHLESIDGKVQRGEVIKY